MIRVARPASWAPRVPVNRGVSVTLMPVWTRVAGEAFGEVFEQVGGFGAAGGAGVEPVGFVDEYQTHARMVFPAAVGPVTINEGRVVVCWCRPRIISVRTFVVRVAMAGVRTVTNAER
ncbi:hypothetical protein EES42_35370 [Streptomyces sp. ADI95-17]|nr:hypothetical protein EES42_35370 [Streptomyces sp. ADI95-17]